LQVLFTGARTVPCVSLVVPCVACAVCLTCAAGNGGWFLSDRWGSREQGAGAVHWRAYCTVRFACRTVCSVRCAFDLCCRKRWLVLSGRLGSREQGAGAVHWRAYCAVRCACRAVCSVRCAFDLCCRKGWLVFVGPVVVA
jgi:hypothetical protein